MAPLNDAEVTSSNFRFRKENKTLKEFQRKASILFYCRSSTSSTSSNDHAQDGILVAAEAVETVSVAIVPEPVAVAVAVAVALSHKAVAVATVAPVQ